MKYSKESNIENLTNQNLDDDSSSISIFLNLISPFDTNECVSNGIKYKYKTFSGENQTCKKEGRCCNYTKDIADKYHVWPKEEFLSVSYLISVFLFMD